MTRSTFAIKGERVCVTHNIQRSRTGDFIHNGASGVVQDVDVENQTVTVDIDQPVSKKGVKFSRYPACLQRVYN